MLQLIVFPLGTINGDLGPTSKYYTVKLHFPTVLRPYGIPQRQINCQHTFHHSPLELFSPGGTSFAPTRMTSPLGSKIPSSWEASWSSPWGRLGMWRRIKIRRQPAAICYRDMPGSVQRQFPCLFLLNLPGRAPRGGTFMVFISHMSKVQSREERGPASTPCSGKWWNQLQGPAHPSSGLSCLSFPSHLCTNDIVLTATEAQTPWGQTLSVPPILSNLTASRPVPAD